VKIGIISDIHGNLPALQAVLRTLKDERCVRILCAGDVVGYGPYPLECIETVEQERIACVQGNHDFWVAVGGRDWRISPNARLALEWTCDALPRDAVEWLGKLPASIEYGGLYVVHASCAYRPPWAYVLSERLLTVSFLFQPGPYAFHGHTHMPLLGIHRRKQRPRFLKIRDMVLTPDARYLVNVGSVGQPRDRNPDAACAVFDTRTREFRLLRVPYDVARVQKRMRQVGLPEPLIERLAKGR